jgi:quinolinate synthase
LLLWEGYCNIHDSLTAQDILKAKMLHPNAVVLAHPECRPEVLDLADVIRSTSGMITYCGESKEKEFIVGTENGIIYQLEKRNPYKSFYPASDHMLCPNMKRTRLPDVIKALETMEPIVKVEEDIRVRALKAVDRMLAVPRD